MRQPIVPSFPNQLLVILLKVNKIIWLDINFPIIWGWGVEGVDITAPILCGADKEKVLFRRLSETYLSRHNLFLHFLYIERDRRKNKHRSDTNFLTRLMIFLFPWLYFMQHLLQEYEEQET